MDFSHRYDRGSTALITDVFSRSFTSCGEKTSSSSQPVGGPRVIEGRIGSRRTSNFVTPTSYKAWRMISTGYVVEGVGNTSAGSVSVRHLDGGNVAVSNLNGTASDYINVSSSSINLPSSVINARNKAITIARVRLGGRKTEISTTLAESRKSYSYVADRVLDLAHCLRDIRRGRFGKRSREAVRRYQRELPRDPKKHLKSVASRWMEYNYAVMPIVYDINSYADLVQNGLSPDRAIISGRSRQTIKRDGLTFHVNVKLNATLVSNARRRSNQLGISSTNFIWEMMPWSFVVDWAFDVSSFLEAANATSGLRFHSGYSSIKVSGTETKKNDGTMRVISRSGSQGRTCILTFLNAGWRTHEIEYYERTSLNSFIMPSSPVVKNPLSTVKRGITASALLILKGLRS